jgi:DNA excision repair protein ERCC-4
MRYENAWRVKSVGVIPGVWGFAKSGFVRTTGQREACGCGAKARNFNKRTRTCIVDNFESIDQIAQDMERRGLLPTAMQHAGSPNAPANEERPAQGEETPVAGKQSRELKPTIMVDSREKLPYQFSSGVKTAVAGLPFGDYSLAGLEQEIVIERKSLGDLLGSITTGRKAFERELKALRTYRLAVLMIEADWGSILLGNYRAAVSPAAVIGSLMAFASRYGVMPVLEPLHKTV